MRIKFLLSFVVGFLLSMVAYGQTTTWIGTPTNTNISTPTNWSNGLPTGTKIGKINSCSNCPELQNNVILTDGFNKIDVVGGKIILSGFTLTIKSITTSNNATITSTGGSVVATTSTSINNSIFNGNINITTTTFTSIGNSTFAGAVNITTTTSTSIGSSTFAGAVNITTKTLTDISGSTFGGNVNIRVNGSGSTNGGNTFTGTLDLELSNLSTAGVLSLNTLTPSNHLGACTFTNNSSRLLIIASHLLGESTFAQQCVVNNNGNGTINISNVDAKVKFTDNVTLNNTRGTINTANTTSTTPIITITNSLGVNFASTNPTNICVINLNNVAHSNQADNIVINVSNGTLGIKNSTFAGTVSFLGVSIPTTNNTSVSIIGSTFAGAVNITTKTLTNISGSTFGGNVNIIVNGSGSTSGGNTFKVTLDLELSSSASGTLSLNTLTSSNHLGACTFTNNSSRSLTIASHPQGESTFGENCTINNTNIGITNIANNTTKVRFKKICTVSNTNTGNINIANNNSILQFEMDCIINNIIGQTSISKTKGVCTVNNIVMNNSGGIISTADADISSKLNVNNSLKANFIVTGSNIGTINLNRITHNGATDNVIIDASDGILNVTNATFDCPFNVKGNNKALTLTTNTFKKVFVAEQVGNGVGAINIGNTLANALANANTFNESCTIKVRDAGVIKVGNSNTFKQSFTAQNSGRGTISIGNTNSFNQNSIIELTNTGNVNIGNNNIFTGLFTAQNLNTGAINIGKTNTFGETIIEVTGAGNVNVNTNNIFKGNFATKGAGGGNVNMLNNTNNSFEKDIILDKLIVFNNNNCIITLNGDGNQVMKSTIVSFPLQNIPTLVIDKTVGDILIKTPISISTELRMSNNALPNRRAVIDGTLDSNDTPTTLNTPMLEIGINATIVGINYLEQTYIKGPVRKMFNKRQPFSFMFPVGGSKCQPLTLSSLTNTINQTGLSVTVQYNNPPILDTPPTTINNSTGKFISNLEHWKLKTNFSHSAVSFTLNALQNTQIYPFGGIIRSFGWELTGTVSGTQWKEISNIISISNPNTILSSTLLSPAVSTPLQFISGITHEIRLGYDAVLEIDVADVAPKNFTISGTPSLANLPNPTTVFSTGSASLLLSPIVTPSNGSGTISVNINSANLSKITIDYPLQPIPVIKVGSSSFTPETLLPEFYKVTTPAVGHTKLKFYKTPQTSTTLLGITTNLSDGIKVGSSLQLTFPNSRYELTIYKSGTPSFSDTVSMPTSATTLAWTPPNGIAPGSYKFTLTDLTTSTIVYQGQFIK